MRTKEDKLEYIRWWQRKNHVRVKKCQRSYYLKNKVESKRRYLKNRDDFLKRSRERYAKNPQYQQNYCAKNRVKIRKRNRRRLKTNPSLRLLTNLRTQLSHALKGQRKSRPVLCLLGCSLSEFKAHLRSLFKPGMTFENYGKWHIDHIRPCVSFDLSDPAEQALCFHFTNLQPLWAADNQRKTTHW